MGEPPRLREILLDWDQSLVYFVTFCVQRRDPVLANDETFSAIRVAAGQLRKWRVLAGVVMPDHVHFVVTPVEDRSLSVGDFSIGFKRCFRRAAADHLWQWQRGCFDRLLRSDESLHNKWIYIEDNPVRAGLVQNVSDWRYYLGGIAEQANWQLPVPKPILAKLTAPRPEESGERWEADSFPYRGKS